jgi:hypothetical protein
MMVMVAALLFCAGCEQQPAPRIPAQPPAAQPPAPPAPPPPELTADEAAQIPPFPPTNGGVILERSKATLTWDASPLENVVKYRIYEKDGRSRWVKIGETSIPRFVDRTPQPKGEYGISAVNAYGAESPRTEVVIKKQ